MRGRLWLVFFSLFAHGGNKGLQDESRFNGLKCAVCLRIEEIAKNIWQPKRKEKNHIKEADVPKVLTQQLCSHGVLANGLDSYLEKSEPIHIPTAKAYCEELLEEAGESIVDALGFYVFSGVCMYLKKA